MRMTTDDALTGRQRTALRMAREHGYLRARPDAASALVHLYGRWCWRLRIPLVWYEPRTPNSRYGRLHLEMFTSAHVLTAQGREEAEALSSSGARFCCRASAHDAHWDYVPLSEIGALARKAFRAATAPGNRGIAKAAPRRIAASA